jgi:CHAD domain-containing protein
LHLIERNAYRDPAVERRSAMRVGSLRPVCFEGTHALNGEPTETDDIKPHPGPGPRGAPVAGYPPIAGISALSQTSYAAALTEGASLQDAVASATGAALQQFRAHMAAAELGNAEGIHQMRVALRRLRTVFVLFAPCCDRRTKDRFNKDIRKAAAPLGTSRDWDVFAIQTLPQAMKDGVGEDLLADLACAAQIGREKAHAAVRRLIQSRQLAVLVGDIEIRVADGTWRAADGEAAATPAVKRLPGLLDRLLRKVEKRAKGLSHLSPKELHPLRKSIKKLRYSAEDTAGLFKRKHVADFIKHCKKLQALLGDINDAATTARFIDDMGHAGKSQGARALLAWNEARSARAHDKLAAAWHKFHSADAFWQ